MTSEDILTMLKAGYTKAEIDAMETVTPAEVTVETETTKEATTDTVEASKVEAGNVEDNKADSYGELLKAINDLNKNIQFMNRGDASNSSTDVSNKETVNDILKTIVRR